MGKSKKQAKKEELPLPPPVPYSLYPLRVNEPEELMPWGGEYLLTPEDYVALQDTVGLPLKKSEIKVFLIKKCNVPDPTNYSFPEITETLRYYLEEKRTSKSVGKNKALPNDLITFAVAKKKYHVSQPTLMRAIKDGRLRSFRPKNCSKNHQHKVSESQVGSMWPTR